MEAAVAVGVRDRGSRKGPIPLAHATPLVESERAPLIAR